MVKSGPNGQLRGTERPDAKGVEGSVRAALKTYIETVLFDPASPDGESFRNAALEGKDEAGREAAKREMLAQAGRWMPKARGWERNMDGENAVYSGRLLQVHTEITLDSTGKVRKIHVELE